MSGDSQEQLKEFCQQHGFVIPDRGLKTIGDEVKWRNGTVPDYTMADLFFFKGKSQNHAPGSMEMVVENLIKKWEMEITHFFEPTDCSTMKVDEFRMKANNGKEVGATELLTRGSYNVLLADISNELYNAESHTFDSSQGIFRNTFEEGFGWEVIHVFSGPPRIGFTWRHWGKFTGTYKDRKGNGEVIEMYGFTVGTVSDDLKLTRVENYYKPEDFLKCLEGKMSLDEQAQGKNLFGSGCPFHK